MKKMQDTPVGNLLDPNNRNMEAPRQNAQRYKIFWDCVTRYANPGMGFSNVVAEDGGYYGQLLRNQFMCNHNEGDNMWSNCVTAAQLGVNRELGNVNFQDMMNAMNNPQGNLTAYECVIAAMPVDDNGYLLHPEQGMALRKVAVVGAYADATTALRNWAQAAPLIMRACAGADILDIDDYMRR